jgi:hypothetical protein
MNQHIWRSMDPSRSWSLLGAMAVYTKVVQSQAPQPLFLLTNARTIAQYLPKKHLPAAAPHVNVRVIFRLASSAPA